MMLLTKSYQIQCFSYMSMASFIEGTNYKTEDNKQRFDQIKFHFYELLVIILDNNVSRHCLLVNYSLQSNFYSGARNLFKVCESLVITNISCRNLVFALWL